jgi:hypothetical protein
MIDHWSLIIRDIVYLIIYLGSLPILYYLAKYLLEQIIHAAYIEFQKSSIALFQSIADAYEIKDISRNNELIETVKHNKILIEENTKLVSRLKEFVDKRERELNESARKRMGET